MYSSRWPFAVLLTLSLAVIGLPSLAAPALSSGDVLLNQALDIFDQAQTIQAAVEVHDSNDRPGTARVLRFQVENAPGGLTRRSRIVTTGGSGSLPIELDDGQYGYIIDSARKTYQREQLGADRFSDLFRIALGRLRRQGVTLTASRTLWHGRPSYLLQGSHGGYALRAVVSEDTTELEDFRGSGQNGRKFAEMSVISLRLNVPFPPDTFQKPGADYRQGFVPDPS